MFIECDILIIGWAEDSLKKIEIFIQITKIIKAKKYQPPILVITKII